MSFFRTVFVWVFCFLSVFDAIEVFGQSLRGSSASLDRQNTQAKEHDFTVLRDPRQLKRFVGLELLVPVQANNDFIFKDDFIIFKNTLGIMQSYLCIVNWYDLLSTF